MRGARGLCGVDGACYTDDVRTPGRPFHRVFFALSGALLAALPSCGECGGSHAVPFRADAGRAALPSPPSPPPAAAPFAPFDGLALPPGTRAFPLDGLPLAVAGRLLAAAAALDLDADGDRDALVVATDDAGRATLEVVPRETRTFGAARSLGPLVLGDGCALESAALRVLAPSYALVTVTPRCAPAVALAAPPQLPSAPTPPAAAPATDAAPRLFLVGLGPTPRLRERFRVLPEAGREPGVVALTVRIEDRDADGSDDVVLEVAVTPPGAAAPARLTLPWLERPSGLARDTQEPETQLAERAARAKRALRRDADGALALAREVLALHGVLCREAGLARVVFGSSEGVPCRASQAAGTAAALAAQALARKGEVLAALEAWASLERPGATVARAERAAAKRALEAMPAEPGVTWRVGPAHVARGAGRAAVEPRVHAGRRGARAARRRDGAHLEPRRRRDGRGAPRVG